jgi:hypothetical protein
MEEVSAVSMEEVGGMVAGVTEVGVGVAWD